MPMALRSSIVFGAVLLCSFGCAKRATLGNEHAVLSADHAVTIATNYVNQHYNWSNYEIVGAGYNKGGNYWHIVVRFLPATPDREKLIRVFADDGRVIFPEQK
jgi:hypothetical protein